MQTAEVQNNLIFAIILTKNFTFLIHSIYFTFHFSFRKLFNISFSLSFRIFVVEFDII